MPSRQIRAVALWAQRRGRDHLDRLPRPRIHDLHARGREVAYVARHDGHPVVERRGGDQAVRRPTSLSTPRVSAVIRPQTRAMSVSMGKIRWAKRCSV